MYTSVENAWNLSRLNSYTTPANESIKEKIHSTYLNTIYSGVHDVA